MKETMVANVCTGDLWSFHSANKSKHPFPPLVWMHTNAFAQTHTHTHTHTQPLLISFFSFPPNRHLAWHTPRSQGSQLSNRCQCMRYNTKGSPITTQMFCFSSSHSLLLFFSSFFFFFFFFYPASSLFQGPLRMAQSLPRTARKNTLHQSQ